MNKNNRILTRHPRCAVFPVGSWAALGDRDRSPVVSAGVSVGVPTVSPSR